MVITVLVLLEVLVIFQKSDLPKYYSFTTREMDACKNVLIIYKCTGKIVTPRSPVHIPEVEK